MVEPPGKSDRYYGREDNGRVFLRHFDEGVVLTMRAVLVRTQLTAGFGSNYFLQNIPNVRGPQDYPGIPVTFSHPENIAEELRIPIVVVRRGSVRPDMQRYHPGAHAYSFLAEGSQNVTINGQTGPLRRTQRGTPKPFKIDYTIRILARTRGGAYEASPRNQAEAVLWHLMSIFQPFCAVYVKDTVGDIRSYSAEAEYDTEDEILDVTGRTIGFTISLTVDAWLDLNSEEEQPTALSTVLQVEQK